MINPAMMNAALAGLLSAVCLSALADPPRKHSAISTGEISSSMPSMPSAPAIEEDAAVGEEGNAIEATARSSANSMHTEINAMRTIADEDEAQALRQTGE